MRHEFLIWALTFLLSQICLANPCYLDSGDSEADPKQALFRIEFAGPTNPFWSYVSENSESWKFKIVQKSEKSASIPKFEQFSAQIADAIDIDLKNDLIFKSNTELQIKSTRIKEIIEAYRKFFEDFRKKNPATLPKATQQILQFYISFKSPSQQNTEKWLNHHCSIGLGLNSLSLSLPDKRLDPGIEIEVNNPDLNGAWYGSPLPLKFNLEAKAGKAEIRGLPIGTFIAKLDMKPNTDAPVASIWSVAKSCKMVLSKESEKSWTITENNCRSGQ